MPADAGVRASVDALADVAVEVLALVRLHRDVAGEGVHEVDVFFGGVHELPDVAARLEFAEEAGGLDLVAEVGDIFG